MRNVTTTHDVVFTEAELEAIEALAEYALPEGTRCPVCHRRRNKERKNSSPTTSEVRIRLPNDRAEYLQDALDALQEYVGADRTSYPRGTLLEALTQLGAQSREELKDYFEGRE